MSGIHRPLVLLLAASVILSGLFSSDGNWPSQASAQEVLRLGSWNIKLLGSKGSTQTPDDLAKYIAFAKVDILALQEITPNGSAPMGFAAPFETSTILDQVCAKLNQSPGVAWKHILFPAHFVDPKEGKKQWTGIAWNEKKVHSVGVPFKIPVSNMMFQTGNDEDGLWKRNAHAMKFSVGAGKTDFLLIPVHMKSNRGKGNFRPHREAEAKEMVAQLPAIDKAFPGEKDLIILGDTNFLKDDKLEETARKVFTAAKFKDLNAENVGTFLGKAPFDRFFVSADQPEFKLSSQTVLRDFLKQEGLSMDQFESRFSDHLMIVTEMQIMKDDD